MRGSKLLHSITPIQRQNIFDVNKQLVANYNFTTVLQKKYLANAAFGWYTPKLHSSYFEIIGKNGCSAIFPIYGQSDTSKQETFRNTCVIGNIYYALGFLNSVEARIAELLADRELHLITHQEVRDRNYELEPEFIYYKLRSPSSTTAEYYEAFFEDLI